MRWLPLLSPLALLLATTVGCKDADVDVVFRRPTLVAVDPRALEGPACLEAPGAWRAYVATFTDTTPFWPEMGAGATGERCESKTAESLWACAPFELPSTPLVSCWDEVGTAFLRPGHRYTAEIDGYDRTELEPLRDANGAPLEGTRILVDPETGQVVDPAWRWSCPSPVAGVDNWTVYVRGCRLEQGAQGTGETAISVSLPGLQDSDPGPSDPGPTAPSAASPPVCGEAQGEIERYTATVVATGESYPAACDESLVIPVDEQARAQGLWLDAFEAEHAEPTWGSFCTTPTEVGVTVPAACDPLTTQGALSIDTATVVATLEGDCACVQTAEEDLACGCLTVTVKAELTGSEQTAPPTQRRSRADFDQPMRFDDLRGGQEYEATLTVTTASGNEQTVTCSARVPPGRTVACEPQ